MNKVLTRLVEKFHLKSTHEVIALKKLASNNELTESLYCYASIEEGVKSYLIEYYAEDKYFIFLDGVEDLKQRNHHTQLSIIVLAITVLATEKINCQQALPKLHLTPFRVER